MHRIERGSAGSNPTITTLERVDPALPRSVLCFMRLLFTDRGHDGLSGLLAQGGDDVFAR
jgi:hypothetical protein